MRRILNAALALASVHVAPTPLPGQGLPFHTETALTTAFEERGLRVLGLYSPRDSVSALVTRVVFLPFAPHERVTTKVALPLVHKRVTAPGSGGNTLYSQVGLGDLSLAAKWAFLVRDRFAGTARLALAANVSVPTGATGRTFADGAEAPRPLQLGTGAFAGGALLVGTLIRGQWGVSADVGHTRHATADGFRFGPSTRYDVALGLRLPRHVETIYTRTWQIYLEWNGSVAGQSVADGTKVADSGGHVAFLSPGLQWVPLPQLLFEASLQVPVAQDLNASQPEYGLRPALGLRFLFF